MAISAVLLMSSCTLRKMIIPAAVSEVSKIVSIDELNLTNADYQIVSTETAEGVIVCEFKGNKIIVVEPNGEYMLTYVIDKKTREIIEIEHEGVVKYGYLSAYDRNVDYYKAQPTDFSRGLAAYRLIESAQNQGADGIIEPMTTMKVEQDGKNIIYTTTITAKFIKINTK